MNNENIIKFTLRIPEKLKQEIKIQSAKDDAYSMNEWITKVLQDTVDKTKDSKK